MPKFKTQNFSNCPKKIIKYFFYALIKCSYNKLFLGSVYKYKKPPSSDFNELVIVEAAYSIADNNNVIEKKEKLLIRKIQCYYSHKYRFLFDIKGQRLLSCCSAFRWESIPSKIEVNPNSQIIDEELIYVGDIEMGHYGHFLIEGLAHLWAAFENISEKNRYLYLGRTWNFKNIIKRKNCKFIDDFMSLAGLSRNQFFFLNEDSFLLNLYLPEPSFIIDNKLHISHMKSFDAVILKLNLKDTTRTGTVYLSRSKFNSASRKIHNEKQLENILLKYGVDIVFPEELTLTEQILMFNNYEKIIAPFGSAIHTQLFSRVSNLKMFVLTTETTNLNTVKIIDSITNTKSFYIPSMTNLVIDGKPDFQLDKTINVDKTIAKLHAYGALSN